MKENIQQKLKQVNEENKKIEAEFWKEILELQSYFSKAKKILDIKEKE